MRADALGVDCRPPFFGYGGDDFERWLVSPVCLCQSLAFKLFLIFCILKFIVYLLVLGVRAI